jgi:hypothetical protein
MLLKPKLPKPLGFRQGRNYTPSETVRCVLPEAPCREPDAFRRYEICRAHPVEVTLPLRWLCQLPLCIIAARERLQAICTNSNFSLIDPIRILSKTL